MKIKIIDLFNKIYNYEDVPRKIILDNRNWFYNDKYQDYFDEEHNSLIKFLIDDFTYETRELLNTEVEIIEEDKMIKNFDIESENGQYKLEFKSCSYPLNDINYIVLSKLNEIIDEVNKLKENK